MVVSLFWSVLNTGISRILPLARIRHVKEERYLSKCRVADIDPAIEIRETIDHIHTGDKKMVIQDIEVMRGSTVGRMKVRSLDLTDHLGPTVITKKLVSNAEGADMTDRPMITFTVRGKDSTEVEITTWTIVAGEETAVREMATQMSLV